VRLITDELARRDRAITGLVGAAGTTFHTLATRRTDIDRLLRQLPPTLDRMHASFTQLQGTLAQTRPALAALRPAARALPTGLTALRELSGDADPALAALRPAVRELNPLARHLAPTASALSSAFQSLEPQLPRIDRITSEITPCERRLQKFFAWTMSVFKFGNRSDRTSSPRGLLVSSIGDASNGADPNLVPVVNCANGRPTR
jgi:ABC-type transporter Mla subunit MlaD